MRTTTLTTLCASALTIASLSLLPSAASAQDSTTIQSLEGCSLTAWANLRVGADQLPAGADQYTDTFTQMLAFPGKLAPPVDTLGAEPASPRQARNAWVDAQAAQTAQNTKTEQRADNDLETIYARATQDLQTNETNRETTVNQNYTLAQQSLDQNEQCAEADQQTAEDQALQTFDSTLDGADSQASNDYTAAVGQITNAFEGDGSASSGSGAGYDGTLASDLQGTVGACADAGSGAGNVDLNSAGINIPAGPDGSDDAQGATTPVALAAAKKTTTTKKNTKKTSATKKNTKKTSTKSGSGSSSGKATASAQAVSACQDRAQTSYDTLSSNASTAEQNELQAAADAQTQANADAQTAYNNAVQNWEDGSQLFTFAYDDESTLLGDAQTEAIARSQQEQVIEQREVDDAHVAAQRILEDYYGVTLEQPAGSSD
jgi:hypothetical protein